LVISSYGRIPATFVAKRTPNISHLSEIIMARSFAIQMVFLGINGDKMFNWKKIGCLIFGHITTADKTNCSCCGEPTKANCLQYILDENDEIVKNDNGVPYYRWR
jgi:formylmethanofuran dehydrogenase subunit E